jgi:hypothetical protein
MSARRPGAFLSRDKHVSHTFIALYYRLIYETFHNNGTTFSLTDIINIIVERTSEVDATLAPPKFRVAMYLRNIQLLLK